MQRVLFLFIGDMIISGRGAGDELRCRSRQKKEVIKVLSRTEVVSLQCLPNKQTLTAFLMRVLFFKMTVSIIHILKGSHEKTDPAIDHYVRMHFIACW